jgi:glycosidase
MNRKFKRAAILAVVLVICAWTSPETPIFTDAIAISQDQPQYGTPFSGVPDPRDVNMYQVHIRPYSAAGDLAGVIARLDNIRALGTNVIYLMPIYPNGGSDPRSLPSPYCITDFKSVASEYGTLADLRALVDGAHNRGMAVILDFAVNGTSWDHPWITQHPDWYVQVNGVIQQLASFRDVAALNFNNTAMRAALVDALRYWIFAANIDGYRCDFANNPPLDFWADTINNLRSITTHKLLMFAEGDRPQNFQVGFDLNFGDKWYYDAISRIATGASVAQIQATTDTEYTFATGNQQVVRYTANHDTIDRQTPFSVFQNHDGVVVNFLVSAYMLGVPFLTSGQEVDFNQRITFPYQTVKIDFNANPGAAADFTKILNFRTSSNAIRRGTMTNYSDDNVCAFTKINGTEKVVVMANLRNGLYNYTIPSAFAGSYEDAYTGASVTLTSGATQSLTAFQYVVLTNAGADIVPVTGVSVSPISASISAGLTQQLTATVAPSNATNQNVAWTSSNTSVATVNSTGLVTAVAAGAATITVTTEDGNKTATSAITVTPAVITYYNIVNRYRPESYLYDGGNGQVKYGTSPGGNTLYQWTRVDASNGYVRFKNRSTGNFMHVENQNGSVQCGVIGSDWYSAMWTIANATDGWNYIQNRWQPNEWIHIENLLGYAQYANPQYGWYSAMWRFVNPVVCPR